MIPQADINAWFVYHPPNRPDLIDKYTALRSTAKQLAELINMLVPDCADKTHSIRVLRDSVMWANAALACNDPGPAQETKR